MKVIELNEKDFDVEVLQSDKKVMIDFYANWCGPCRMMSPIIEELSNEMEDVKFVKINVDENENISRKYGVMSIPMFVVVENGEEKAKTVGMQSKDRIKELLK